MMGRTALHLHYAPWSSGVKDCIGTAGHGIGKARNRAHRGRNERNNQRYLVQWFLSEETLCHASDAI